jgi:tetratricopeptide (TPR) repeat protein
VRPKALTAIVTCVAFATALFAPLAARAQNAPPAPPPTGGEQGAIDDEAMTRAKGHFEAGRNAYNAGDYVGAIREFKAAEALRPSPILAYNIGLANEKLGKRRVAVKYYRRYLEQVPNAQNRSEVEGRIATLEREIAAEPPPPPAGAAPPPGAAAPPPNAPPTFEQPSDMPPPPGAPGQPVYAGADPYASSAPAPVTLPAPQKKKSYWWVWLIVAGGVTLVIAVTVWAVLTYGTVSSGTYDRASTQGLGQDRKSFPSDARSPALGAPLFRF